MTTRKWGTEKLVNTTTLNDQVASKVAALTGGRFVVVWEDRSGAHPAIRGQLFDATGTKLGGEIAIAVSSSSDEIMPNVTGLPDGGFLVTWTELPVGASILGRVYNADGGFVRSQPVAHSNLVKLTNSDAAHDLIGSAVVWEQSFYSGTDIGYRWIYTDGLEGDILPVNEVLKPDGSSGVPGDQVQPAIALEPGAVAAGAGVIVWVDLKTDSIEARLSLSSGFPFDQFHICNVDPNSDTLSDPDVAWLDPTRFAVAWVHGAPSGALLPGDGIEFRIFNANFGDATQATVAMTDVIRVMSPMPRLPVSRPTMTTLAGGGFVLAWEDERGRLGGIGPDDDLAAIRLQAFDDSGNKIGGEITVNTTTTAGQREPSVAALPDGRVVVSWTDDSGTGGDLSGSAVRMQIVDPRDGIVTGTGGNDTLYGNDQVNDEISGGAGDDKLYGMRGDDSLYGGEGNDLLNGGKGADIMVGGLGDDTYYVDNVDDSVIENLNEGTDTVYASVNYALDPGSSIQYLRANAGSTGLTLTGNELNNTIVGGAGSDTLSGGSGNDTLDGRAGADTMIGGPGDDKFYVDNAGDTVKENPGEGNDTVYSSVSYALGIGTSIQFLRANAGSAPLTLTGNEFDNTIIGNTGADTLSGGSGNDTLQGGSGADILTGGIGADLFQFTAVGDSSPAAMDSITDFSTTGGDKIDLHLIDANPSLAGDQAFSFIGTNAFSGAAGQLRYAASGGNTLISGDVNGDKVADFSILVSGAHAFGRSDFVL